MKSIELLCWYKDN